MISLLAAMITYSYCSLADSPSKPVQETEDKSKYLAISKQDVVFGDPDAPNTVIEYFSLTCFHCAIFYEKFYPAIKKEFIDRGKVKWVKRLYITDQRAMPAGMLLECKKPNEEAYRKFLTILLAKQDVWVTGKNYLDVLKNLAKLSGMSSDQIEGCLTNEQQAKVLTEQTMIASKKLGIKATPSFFFNGRLQADGMTIESLHKMVGK